MSYIIVIVKTGMMEDIEKTNKKEIVKTWLTGSCSCTLVIPKEFAKDYELDKPAHVLLEKRHEGILIKKLVL